MEKLKAWKEQRMNVAFEPMKGMGTIIARSALCAWLTVGKLRDSLWSLQWEREGCNHG